MAWSNLQCDGACRSMLIKPWCEKLLGLVVVTILTFFPTFASATEVSPSTQQSESGALTSDTTPKKPSEPGVPAVPQSPIDPGILHVPEKREAPGGSVKPPIVDPNMPTTPDVMPTPPGGIIPPDGSNPPRKQNPQTKPDAQQ